MLLSTTSQFVKFLLMKEPHQQIDSIIGEFQTSSGINSTKTVRWECHGISFHDQAAPVQVVCRYSPVLLFIECMWGFFISHIQIKTVLNMNLLICKVQVVNHAYLYMLCAFVHWMPNIQFNVILTSNFQQVQKP